MSKYEQFKQLWIENEFLYATIETLFMITVATIIAYRKMSGAAPIKVNMKVVGKVLYGVVSSLVLGLGMAMVMVFEGMMLLGMVVGIVGIVMLLFLIPMCVGLKNNK